MNKVDINRFERRKQQTKKKILNAAAKLFEEVGFSNVKISDITDAADVGRGTFYLHFDTKDNLLRALIIEEYLEIQNDEFSKGLLKPRSLEAYILAFKIISEKNKLFRVMFSDLGSIKASRQILDRMSFDFLKSLQQKEILFDIDAPFDLISQYLAGGLYRLVMWWLDNQDKYSYEEMGKYCYQISQIRTGE